LSRPQDVSGAGTAVGLGLALVVARLLEQILYGVEPTDPVTYATVFLMIFGIATVACCIPALRAIRINPVIALRQE
jgi:ABC-type antimicrobial peptide transport system permease subunit